MNLSKYIDAVADRFDSAALFYGHGTDNSLDEAVYLIYGLLGIDYQSSINEIDRELSATELEELDKKVKARVEQRVPVAYLLNEAWFAGLRFYSDERALVPRSPIGELIQNRFQALPVSIPSRVLDLCCGGGCIGIATAIQYESTQVDLVDIDEGALELAQSNIALYELETRVRTVHSDLFAALDGKYDLIICNPPYVSQREYDSLPTEFKKEPAIGLISEQEGLALPSQILNEATNYLTNDGMLIMEVGYSADLLAQRFSEVPFLWLEFASGGAGVLALSRQQLERYSEEFN